MKKILFITGTRADFGKLKSLILKVEKSNLFEAHVFITGMHLLSKYGMTANEVEKSGFSSIYKYINQGDTDTMDVVLAKTIYGLTDYVKEAKPDMIVVHGDRVEALAGSIVGALNNILVAHIEGGEVSGTIDELIRHSISKMSHIHFVCNKSAKHRLIQLGEKAESIYIIGSPDIDIMASPNLPSIEEAKERYNISFKQFALFLYHPVTTDLENLPSYISSVTEALIQSKDNFIVIMPNNDNGSNIITSELKRLEGNKSFRIFPSIRFEHFLVLLKHSMYIIGNSSAGVREMPFYGLPSINIGDRQKRRAKAKSITNCDHNINNIINAILESKNRSYTPEYEFGQGNSSQLFFQAISSQDIWEINKQKTFMDIT